MTSQTQAAGADTSEQAVVAGVFTDHSAGMAALEKLQAMGAQLSEAGVTGVLILAKMLTAGSTHGRRSWPVPRRAPRR